MALRVLACAVQVMQLARIVTSAGTSSRDEDSDELCALQAHGHLARAMVAEGSCVDAVGWMDNGTYGCIPYVGERWCTSDGGYGDGWMADWGNFSIWTGPPGTGTPPNEGCCGCGRQDSSGPPSGTLPPSSVPAQTDLSRYNHIQNWCPCASRALCDTYAIIAVHQAQECANYCEADPQCTAFTMGKQCYLIKATDIQTTGGPDTSGDGNFTCWINSRR